MRGRKSFSNGNGPGASAVNGAGQTCPVSLCIDGEKLNPNHQLDMA